MAGTDLRIFRDAQAAVINSSVMAATGAGWLGSFALMARPNPAQSPPRASSARTAFPF